MTARGPGHARFLRVETPLGLFSVLWALAACLHHLEAHPFAGLALYPFAVLLLVFPERIWALALFAAVHGIRLWMHLPSAANHSVIALLVNACLLVGCARAIGGDPATRGRRLWDFVKGPLKATVAVVYGFAIFHKLNSSFFDPEVSCATAQVVKMFDMHGFAGHPSASAFAFNIHLTLVFEAAILLLLWPRFTHVAALVGLAFHTGLAWASFYDFATVAFALYLFFFPWERLGEGMALMPRWAGACFLAALTVLVATSVTFHGFLRRPVLLEWPSWSLTANTVICAAWTVLAWPVLLPVFSRRCQAAPGERRWSGTAAAWAIPLVAAVNGSTSYLGLKTVANYSMFSNLRTEGGITNHFLVPARQFFVAGYQDDLVQVDRIHRVPPDDLPLWMRLAGGQRLLRRNARWVEEVPGARVPFVELQRTLQFWRDVGHSNVSVAYERNGTWREVDDALADPELMAPLNFAERKLMAYRAVQWDGEESWCRW